MAGEQQPDNADTAIVRIWSKPGIQRDGTALEGDGYIDGKWCRWYRNLPRKMLGYREQLRNVTGIQRQIYIDSRNGYSTVHVGSQTLLQRYQIEINTGNVTGVVSRTPAGLVTSANNNWQFDAIYNTGTTTGTLLAHYAPNINDIASTIQNTLYYGPITSTAALVAIAGSDVSGGVVVLHPYTFRYGNDGFLGWSVPGVPTDIVGAGSGTARVTSQKIVRGLPLRAGPGNAPAGLFWSLNSLIRATFIGGAPIFSFDELTTSASILSSNGVIENNGIYYWATVSGFSMFNGVVRDLPNNKNLDWFLKNLNWRQRQKVFATKIPRWGEIWWCFPYGTNTECTHAVIFNYREGTWYDTELPNGGRSAGQYEQVYSYPIMSGVESHTTGYSMWQQELGLDEVAGAPIATSAIDSYFRTNEMSLVVPGQDGGSGKDLNISYSELEPDFEQAGDMTVTLYGRPNARAVAVANGPHDILADPAPNQQLVKFKKTSRLNSFLFRSNIQGGNYTMGVPLIHIKPSDGRNQS